MSSLVVVVCGGGPVGLTFSLNLTMIMGKKATIRIYDGRWFVNVNGITQWRDEEQGNYRRDQVVSLQDHVIEQLPKYIKKGLFKNINERVWPKSRNIPIREVEDRLLELIQPFVKTGQIELIPERLKKESDCIRKGCFHILVGADGPESFVRKYSNIPMVSEGMEYACGVAYNIPLIIPKTEEPLHQALNCILANSQTRFLVNSSYSRSGYLNIRLIESEFKELNKYIETCERRNERCNLLDYNKFPSTPLWTIVRQGLGYFKIDPKFVTHIVPITINVCYASAVVRELRLQISEEQDQKSKSKTLPKKNSDENQTKKHKIVLACLVGDAAIDVHFWSGRGMNTGIKAAIALARNIVHSCASECSPDEIVIRTPCPFLQFLDYEGFMARLRARELQGRSLDVLIVPIDASVIEAYYYIYLTQSHAKYTKKLIKKLKKSRDSLEKLSDWPHRNRPITNEELESVSKRISPLAIAQLSLADPSPPRELSEVEILVEDTFPFHSKYYLPVPRPTSNKILLHPLVPSTLPNPWSLAKMNGVEVPNKDTTPFDESHFSSVLTKATNKIKRSVSNDMPPQVVAQIPLANMQVLPDMNGAEMEMENTFTFYQKNVSYTPTGANLIVTPWVDYYMFQ